MKRRNNICNADEPKAEQKLFQAAIWHSSENNARL